MENKVLEKIKTLKHKDESIKLSGVYPWLLEQELDLLDGITIIGGRDFDYYAETPIYHIDGSAYYGTATVTLKSKTKLQEENKGSENIYTRTSFEFHGKMITDIPEVVECNDETLKELIGKGVLQLYYIGFKCYDYMQLIPFYAVSEGDVRRRALSIWGRYDDIKSDREVEDIEIRYADVFPYLYKVSEKQFVLNWR